MEGLLQSFKFDKFHIQREVCKLVGLGAKKRGAARNKAWQREQKLWWREVAYKRDSDDYQRLLDRAFKALATNEKFRKALIATGDAPLTHSIGKRKQKDTVLTEAEFCSRLVRIRAQINNGEL
jgi:rRNA-processing protein FCF1